jgi:death-on-curing protein
MTKYLTFSQIVELHDTFLKEYGGLEGIRDGDILNSVVEMPKSSFGGEELYPSIFEKACVYLFHIARGHPFFDGNKRTAAATLIFLRGNAVFLDYDVGDFADFVTEVASGERSKGEVLSFLRQHSETS